MKKRVQIDDKRAEGGEISIGLHAKGDGATDNLSNGRGE